jgi:hypothetical protein
MGVNYHWLVHLTRKLFKSYSNSKVAPASRYPTELTAKKKVVTLIIADQVMKHMQRIDGKSESRYGLHFDDARHDITRRGYIRDFHNTNIVCASIRILMGPGTVVPRGMLTTGAACPRRKDAYRMDPVCTRALLRAWRIHFLARSESAALVRWDSLIACRFRSPLLRRIHTRSRSRCTA